MNKRVKILIIPVHEHSLDFKMDAIKGRINKGKLTKVIQMKNIYIGGTKRRSEWRNRKGWISEIRGRTQLQKVNSWYFYKIR